jgi:predicted transposase YbfD/YdcC
LLCQMCFQSTIHGWQMEIKFQFTSSVTWPITITKNSIRSHGYCNVENILLFG